MCERNRDCVRTAHLPADQRLLDTVEQNGTEGNT